MAREQFSITAKALPHVAHFIRYHYGNPAELAEGDMFHNFLMAVVSRRPDTEEYDAAKIRMIHYTDQITLLVSKRFYDRYGLFLTRTNTIKLNRFIDEYIKSVVRMEMISAFAATGRAEAGYETARVKLGLSVDIYPYDAVKKQWQRFTAARPHILSKKFLTQVSPAILEHLRLIYAAHGNNRTA
jgi:hypothetical protein